jgi:KDO2-lipid IV(A) lauroyltransferase
MILILRYLAEIINLLPRTIQIFIGHRIGDLSYFLLKKTRHVGLKNINTALPEQNAKKILRKSFQHFGLALLEVLMLPIAHKANKKWLIFRNMEIFQELKKEDKACILLTAHFGNWEYISCSTLLSLDIYGLYRLQKYGQKLVDTLRNSTGTKFIDSRSSARQCLKILKSGNVLGIVGDQSSEAEVPFFNRPTWFPLGPARLAIQTGVPIMLTISRRRGKYLEIECLGEIPLQQGDSKEETALKTTAFFAGLLEKEIRERPEQYLWMRDFWRFFQKNPEN